MRLSIHVGLPKCGSTTLQETLGGMRGELTTRGVYYPPSFRPNFEAANTRMNNEWAGGDIGVDHVVAEARKAGAHHCILTSEYIAINVATYDVDLLRRAGNWLAANGVELQLIQISRPQNDFLLSMYRQSITNGPENAAKYSDWDLAALRHYYDTSFQTLCDTLRPAEVNRHSLTDSGWIESVFSSLGLPAPSSANRANRSAPDVSIEVLRQFNKMGDAAPSRVYISRLISLAIGRANNSLMRQACRRPPEGARLLSSDAIRSLSFDANHPLSYSRQEFADFKEHLLSLLVMHSSAISSVPRKFINVFEEVHKEA